MIDQCTMQLPACECNMQKCITQLNQSLLGETGLAKRVYNKVMLMKIITSSLHLLETHRHHYLSMLT